MSDDDDLFECSDSEDESSDDESVCSSTSSLSSDLADPSDLSSSRKPRGRGRKRKGKVKKANVWIGNLLPGCSSKDLIEHFKAYKPHIVNQPKIMAPKKGASDPQYRFSFLHFNSLDKAKEAIEKMNGTYFQKRKLLVKLKEKKKTTVDESKTKSTKKSNTKTPAVLQGTKRSSQYSFTVTVQNLPIGIDEVDLKGLVAKSGVISCKVIGQTATLTFSSSKDATNAVETLNKRTIFGANLYAELVHSEGGQDTRIPMHSKKGHVTPFMSHHSLIGPSIASKHPPTRNPISPHTCYPGQQSGGGMYPPPGTYPHSSFIPGGHMPSPCHPLAPPPTFIPYAHNMPQHPHIPLSPPPSHLIGRYGPHPQPMVATDNPTEGRKRRKSSTSASRSEEMKSNTKPSFDSGKQSKESKRKVSRDLYDIFCQLNSLQIQAFKDKGGSLEYDCPTLNLKAPTAKESKILLDFLNTYSERKLVCSPEQWNRLVVVNQQGQREMDALIAPFKFNPALRITEEPMSLVFVGQKDAVDAAYHHISKDLKKEIKIESPKLSDLVQLEPDLPQKIEAQYGLSIEGYTEDSSSLVFDGASENSTAVQSQLQDKLQNICSTSLPVRPYPLLQAGRKDCLNRQIPVLLTERENELVLVCSSESHLQVAKGIFTRQPYINTLDLSNYDEECLKLSFSKLFQFECVNIRDEPAKKIALEGFCKEDVQSAKRVVIKYLKENYKKAEPRNERTLSPELYDMFCKSSSTQIQTFKEKGGSLEYECPILKVKASTAKETQAMLCHLDMYLERPLTCSPEQWNRIIVVNQHGQRELDDLTAPFKFNPAVRIIEQPMKLTFIGIKDAVETAYHHINKHLNRETKLESSQLDALVQLEPDLAQKIEKEYGLSIRGYTENSSSISFDGTSENSGAVESLLKSKLESICSDTVQVRPQPLLHAGKKECFNRQIPIVISVRENELLLVSSSIAHLQVAKQIFTCQPYTNIIDLSRYDEACLKDSFSKMFSFECVNIREEEAKVFLEGFIKEDVQSAKKVISNYLQENYKRVKQMCSETLICSEEQRVYLCRLLNKGEPLEEVRNLPSTVLVKDASILISGTDTERAETSRKLLEIVPEFKCYVFEVKNTRFIKPLLEKHVLMTVDYVILEEKEKEKEKCNRLKVFVYEHNSLALAAVGKRIDILSPGVLFFTVSPKSKGVLKEVLPSLEEQYRCHIDLSSPNSPRVAVHGLTVEERDQLKSAVKEYIEEHYIIIRQLPSPPISSVQMRYILLRHGEELKEQRKSLRSCELPFFLVKKSALELSTEPNICFKVVGSAKAIMAFEDFLKDFIDSSFTEERFDLSISNLNRYPWRKRWEALKQEAEDSQAIVMEFKLPSHDSILPIAFIVYGDQADNVMTLKNTLESEASAGTAKSKALKLTPDQFGLVQTAHKNKQLNFDDYVVEIKFVQKDHLIYINSLKVTEDTIDVVEAEITGFVNCISTISEDIVFPDLALHLVFTDSISFPFYRKALSIAMSGKVSLRVFKSGSRMGVSLKGSTTSVNAVKDQINFLVEEAKQLLGTIDVHIEPLFQPALTQNLRRTLENKLSSNFFTIIQNTPKRFQEAILLESMCVQPSVEALKVKLFLCRGSLATQSTDVIVNPTNESLHHVGSLAKTIMDEGGMIIQQESMVYIQNHGKLKLGEAVCLPSGRLPCKKIVHVVLPQCQGVDDEESKVVLHKAVLNSLQAAEGFTSISLPAVGFGKFNFPADVCADMGLKAVRDFCMSKSQSSLKEISFVLFTKETQKSFRERLSNVFPSEAFQPAEELRTPLTPHSTSNFTWLWKNDHGGYSHYGLEEVQQLAALFSKNPQGTTSLTIRDTLYTIDLARMVQINVKTQYKRKILKVLGKPGLWFWIDHNDTPSIYSPTDSAAIENMYKSSMQQTRVINGIIYQFDFHRMVQINVITGHEYHIQRIPELTFHSSFSASEGMQAKPMTITLYGVKSNLESAKNFILNQLKTSVKVEEIGPLVLGQRFLKKLKEVAGKYKVSYEVKDTTVHGKSLLVIEGVKVDSAVKDLYQYIYENQSSGVDNTPPEWEPQSDTTQLFSVPRWSSEWMKVEKEFNKTMSSYPIQEIQRIQNTYLWEKWVEERNRMEKFKGCVNEKELFHGTQQNDPKQIYDSEIGFDMRFCSSGMWGLANYFAVNASYSHAYSHKNDLGHREMFLVKVITGDSYSSLPDRSLRMPPLKTNTSQLKLSQVRYDTVNGITNGSQVFMTYDNQKAYPAYLIRY